MLVKVNQETFESFIKANQKHLDVTYGKQSLGYIETDFTNEKLGVIAKEVKTGIDGNESYTYYIHIDVYQ